MRQIVSERVGAVNAAESAEANSLQDSFYAILVNHGLDKPELVPGVARFLRPDRLQELICLTLQLVLQVCLYFVQARAAVPRMTLVLNQ